MISFDKMTSKLLLVFMALVGLLWVLDFGVGMPISKNTYGVLFGYPIYSLGVLLLGVLFPTRATVFLARTLQFGWGVTFIVGAVSLAVLLFYGIEKMPISPLWYQRLSLLVVLGIIGGLAFRKIGRASREIEGYINDGDVVEQPA